jgi:IS30 family transposase
MSYTHFTERERYVISHLKLERFSSREIARRLGRHHTSILREIKRNRPTYADDAVYWYYVTQPVAELRRHKARSHRRQKHLPLVEYVEDKLRLDWPPEAIAARIRIDHPKDERMRISHRKKRGQPLNVENRDPAASSVKSGTGLEKLVLLGGRRQKVIYQRPVAQSHFA